MKNNKINNQSSQNFLKDNAFYNQRKLNMLHELEALKYRK